MQSQIGATVNAKSRKILEDKEKKQSETGATTTTADKKEPIKRVQPQRVVSAYGKKEIDKRRSPPAASAATEPAKDKQEAFKP